VDAPTVTRERALRWAAQLPELAAHGLRRVTLTGGEPVLALDAAEVLAGAARNAGLRMAIVSSGAWASTPRAARRIVERLSAVAHWDLGIDEYHAAELSFERFALAVSALKGIGASYSIRVCADVDGRAVRLFLQRLRAQVGEDVPILIQPVRAIGRAGRQRRSAGEVTTPEKPCMSTGPFVREDGSVGPCGAGLAYEGARCHPFDYGNSDRDGLLAIWQRWRADQLPRLMRLLGLALPAHWLAANGHLEREVLGSDVCKSCVALWTANPKAADAARRFAVQPALRELLDGVERHLYGRIWGEPDSPPPT
jgi:hypothetical protein